MLTFHDRLSLRLQSSSIRLVGSAAPLRVPNITMAMDAQWHFALRIFRQHLMHHLLVAI
jgi:hypothetical protein